MSEVTRQYVIRRLESDARVLTQRLVNVRLLLGDRCCGCGKRFTNPDVRQAAYTADGFSVVVGPECYKRAIKAGAAGYQPPNGPRLFFPSRK